MKYLLQFKSGNMTITIIYEVLPYLLLRTCTRVYIYVYIQTHTENPLLSVSGLTWSNNVCPGREPGTSGVPP